MSKKAHDLFFDGHKHVRKKEVDFFGANDKELHKPNKAYKQLGNELQLNLNHVFSLIFKCSDCFFFRCL